MRHGTDGGVLVSNWSNSLTAAVEALSTNGNQFFNWKLTVASHVQHSGFLVIPDHIELDQEGGGYIEFANSSAKIEFQGIGLSRRVLEIGKKFFKNCTVTGKDQWGQGGTTNIYWQNAEKYPLRLRTSLIDDADLCKQFDVLDKAVGSKFVCLVGEPNNIATWVSFAKKREIYMNVGIGEYTNTSINYGHFFIDSDTKFHGHERAVIPTSSHATSAYSIPGHEARFATTIVSTMSYLKTSQGANIYQEKDITIKNLHLTGNGLRESFPATPQSPWIPGTHGAGIYNGTSPLIQLGNALRAVCEDNYLFYPNGYSIMSGLNAKTAVVGGETLGGYHAEEHRVMNNRTVGGMSQMLAIINAKNCEYSKNTFTETAPFPCNITIVDLEANESVDTYENIILDGNRIYAAKQGEKCSLTGELFGPSGSTQVGVYNGNQPIYAQRTFTGIHVQRTIAKNADRIVVQNNEIHGKGVCQFGIKFHDTTNSFMLNNRIFDCYYRFSDTRQNHKLTHKGNVFTGPASGTAIVFSESNFKSEFDDKFELPFGVSPAPTYQRYLEEERALYNINITAGGELSTLVNGQGTDQKVFPHQVGWQFVLNGGNRYKVTEWVNGYTVKTNYSGAAVVNGSIEWRVSDNTYRSDTMTKTLAAESSSTVFKSVNNLKAYVPTHGYNIGSSTPHGIYASDFGRYTGAAIIGGKDYVEQDVPYDFTGLDNPPPEAVLDTARWTASAPLTITITGLTPSTPYRVRLWSCWQDAPYNWEVVVNGSNKGMFYVPSGAADNPQPFLVSTASKADGTIVISTGQVNAQALINAIDWALTQYED